MRLSVATPGYPEARWFLNRAKRSFDESVVDLGHLDRPSLLGHMRRSLCLVQPNRIFLESFGRVFPEAHSVGTPVLAHPMGAVAELITDREQRVEPYSVREFAQRIVRWATGERPHVELDPALTPDSIAQQWEALIPSS